MEFAALALIVAIPSVYVQINAATNDCDAITYIENINLLGKVMQYGMQNEATAQYADMSRLVSGYLARGDTDPWDVTRDPYPPLHQHCFALARSYSETIILHHPLEYAAHSVPVAVTALTATSALQLAPDTAGQALAPLSALDRAAQPLLLLYVPLLAAWIVLRVLRRIPDSPARDMTDLLFLLTAYGLALTTLGGYIYYPRLRTPYFPLLIAAMASATVYLAPQAHKLMRSRRS